VVLSERVLRTHEVSHEIHPSLARYPVAQLDSCGREFHEKRKETMEGGRSFYVCHPPSPLLRLVNGACQVVPVLGERTVGKREVAGRIKWTSKGRSVSRADPVLAALFVLCPELIERFLGCPSLLMVQAVREQQGELEQARAKRGLAVETTPAVLVFQEGPPFYMPALVGRRNHVCVATYPQSW
jgi:hypothetical protein